MPKTREVPASPVSLSTEEEDETIAYLAKRHKVSPAIVKEIIRRIGSSERSAVEREIRKGMSRR